MLEFKGRVEKVVDNQLGDLKDTYAYLVRRQPNGELDESDIYSIDLCSFLIT